MIKVGDIVKVGKKYLAVVTEVDELEEMVRIQDISQIEDNIQPLRCITKATLSECVEELRSIYGYYGG